MTNTNDKTSTLLQRLCGQTRALYDHALDVEDNYEVSVQKYDALSHPNYPLFRQGDIFIDGNFENTIELADDYREYTREELEMFDRCLAKIIELRGQLAEETGIPMMSHLGTEGFGRESAEIKM